MTLVNEKTLSSHTGNDKLVMSILDNNDDNLSTTLATTALARTARSVKYFISRACNYSCKFCFHTQKNSHHLTLAQGKLGLELLRQAGTEKINFAGGEPFLQADLLGKNSVRPVMNSVWLYPSLAMVLVLPSNGCSSVGKLSMSWAFPSIPFVPRPMPLLDVAGMPTTST